MIRVLVAALLGLSMVTVAVAAEPILIVGSTTAKPVIEKIIRAYHRLYPDVAFDLDLTGSNDGMARFLAGKANMVFLSRMLRDDELRRLRQMGGKHFALAYDAIVPVVSQEIPIRALSVQQLRDVYSGRITNWKALGGPEKPILVVTESLAHGTSEVFFRYLFPDANTPYAESPNLVEVESIQQMGNVLRASDQALGYLPVGMASGVRPVKLMVNEDVFAADPKSLAQGEYPLTRPIIVVFGKKPLLGERELLRFMTGKRARKIFRSEGFIPQH